MPSRPQYDVKTTPQVFIGGQRIGGYDDLRRYFGKPVRDPKATSYRPVIAVFAMAALMALAGSWASTGELLTVRAGEWFIAFSMCILALLKLQDVESFSNMFLGYDLLAQRFVPYSYIYPFAEGLAGVLMISGALKWISIPVALFIGDDRRGVGVQGRLHRQARDQMRLRRRVEQRAARLRVADREPDDGRDGAVDAGDVRRPARPPASKPCGIGR